MAVSAGLQGSSAVILFHKKKLTLQTPLLPWCSSWQCPKLQVSTKDRKSKMSMTSIRSYHEIPGGMPNPKCTASEQEKDGRHLILPRSRLAHDWASLTCITIHDYTSSPNKKKCIHFYLKMLTKK